MANPASAVGAVPFHFPIGYDLDRCIAKEKEKDLAADKLQSELRSELRRLVTYNSGNIDRIHPRALEELTKMASQVQVIELDCEELFPEMCAGRGFRDIPTMEKVTKVLARFPNLHCATDIVDRCINFTPGVDHDYFALPRSVQENIRVVGPWIKKLDISGCHSLTRRKIEDLAEIFPNLTQLRAVDCHLTDDICQGLQRFRKLERLDISQNTGIHPGAINFPSGIKQLALLRCDSTAEGCRGLERLENLETLDLSQNPIRDLRVFQFPRRLRELSLSECELSRPSCASLRQYTHLKSLTLDSNPELVSECICTSSFLPPQLSHCPDVYGLPHRLCFSC